MITSPLREAFQGAPPQSCHGPFEFGEPLVVKHPSSRLFSKAVSLQEPGVVLVPEGIHGQRWSMSSWFLNATFIVLGLLQEPGKH